jgi:hypothetical protein
MSDKEEYDWAELVDRMALGHVRSEPYEDIAGKGVMVTLLLSEEDHKALMEKP